MEIVVSYNLTDSGIRSWLCSMSSVAAGGVYNQKWNGVPGDRMSRSSWIVCQ